VPSVTDCGDEGNTPLRWGVLVEGELRYVYDEQKEAWDRACDLRAVGHAVVVITVRV
jgi:hypothetical protein